MIEFFGFAFLKTYALLQDQHYVVKVVEQSGGGLTVDERAYLAGLARTFVTACDAAQLEGSALQARIVEEYASTPRETHNDSMLRASLEALLSHVVTDLSKQRFAYVRPECHQYFQNSQLFGLLVAQHFDDNVHKEIAAIGDCLAIDSHAAAVFHLMRVAELGIRAFIVAKGITIPKRANLEDADWSELITNLDLWLTAQILALGTPSRGSPERHTINLYNGLISDARYLKERRNETMHCRHVFNGPEAEATLLRVRGFMQQMAPFV